ARVPRDLETPQAPDQLAEPIPPLARHHELDPCVEVLGVFPDHYEVHLGMPGWDAGKGECWPDRSEEVELLAEGHVHASEARADRGGDRSLERRAGSADRIEDPVRERRTLPIDHAGARFLNVPLDLEAEGLDDDAGRRCHFRPDPVT